MNRLMRRRSKSPPSHISHTSTSNQCKDYIFRILLFISTLALVFLVHSFSHSRHISHHHISHVNSRQQTPHFLRTGAEDDVETCHLPSLDTPYDDLPDSCKDFEETSVFQWLRWYWESPTFRKVFYPMILVVLAYLFLLLVSTAEVYFVPVLQWKNPTRAKFCIFLAALVGYMSL